MRSRDCTSPPSRRGAPRRPPASSPATSSPTLSAKRSPSRFRASRSSRTWPRSPTSWPSISSRARSRAGSSSSARRRTDPRIARLVGSAERRKSSEGPDRESALLVRPLVLFIDQPDGPGVRGVNPIEARIESAGRPGGKSLYRPAWVGRTSKNRDIPDRDIGTIVTFGTDRIYDESTATSRKKRRASRCVPAVHPV